MENLPLLFEGATFESYHYGCNPAMYKAAEMCWDLASTPWPMNELSPWVVFMHGAAGLGKTHLLSATLHHWAGRNGRAVFWSVPALLAYLQAFVADNDTRGLNGAVDELTSPDILLGLDDLGTEKHTEWAGMQLYRVIDGRYVAQAATVVTSNTWPVEEIDERLRSRMREGFVACEGEDRRGRNLRVRVQGG